MLHSNGQAPRRGKHSIVTFALIKTKPGRRRHFGRSADTSADHPATPRTDGPRLVTISEQKAFRHPELRRDVESSIVETFRLNLTSNKSKIRGSTRIPCDIPATSSFFCNRREVEEHDDHPINCKLRSSPIHWRSPKAPSEGFTAACSPVYFECRPSGNARRTNRVNSAQ